MNKQHVVKCLRIANDLWSISGADFYRVRAHAYAAQAIAETPLSVSEILALPPGTIHGVGKETLAMVRALQTGGLPALLQRLNITLPVEAAELLQLPGIGPKTANTLVLQLGIYSVEQLGVALNEGRLKSIPGLGTSRLSRLQRDIPVFLERTKSIPIALGWPLGLELQAFVSEGPCTLRTAVTGDFRRLALMTTKTEVVVSAANVKETVDWIEQQFSGANPFQIDGEGECVTASTNLERGENVIPLSFHVTPEAMFAPVLMETTGATDHQAVIKGLLDEQGIEWRNGVLYRGGLALRCESEEDIYAIPAA
jgi:DNA polymerase (family 10)